MKQVRLGHWGFLGFLGWGVVAQAAFASGFTLVGCGGPSSGHILTPQERLAEEERLAYEAEQREKKRREEEGEPVIDDTPQAKEFDDKQAEMELKRATRSAESCTGVVREVKERGEATVNISFTNDGSVTKVNVSPPFDGTPLGDCVVNAYKAVIVPPFDGSEHVKNWELTLKDPPPEEGVKGPKKKK